MIRRRFLLLIAAVSCSGLFVSTAPSVAEQAAKVTRTGHVYVFRGFANIFSTGMNTLTNELRRNGIKADVYNHSAYQSVAKQVLQDYKATRGREPVFLVGHSMGGDAAIGVAEILKKYKIPVSLLVTFDAYAPRAVPSNVRHVINYHQYAAEDSAGAKLRTQPDFKGKAENVNVAAKSASVDHFNIDKQRDLHEATIKAILSRTRRK